MRRPVGFPVSKVANVEGDAPELTASFILMDSYPDILYGQHEIRRWEYGMALCAIQSWVRWYWATFPTATDRDAPRKFCDIGGAGSHFWKALTALTFEPITLIDPSAALEVGPENRAVFVFKGTVEEYVPRHPLGQFDVLTCISVVEHVVNVRPFLKACRALLKPGGLLFLTTDYTDTEGDDVFHFHWMRERIYNAGRVRRLMEDARDIGFRNFGESDWTYHGHQVYDYSVCSLAMTRKDPNGQHDRE